MTPCVLESVEHVACGRRRLTRTSVLSFSHPAALKEEFPDEELNLSATAAHRGFCTFGTFYVLKNFRKPRCILYTSRLAHSFLDLDLGATSKCGSND
jgi:hypothetical protein